jgi:hypothetical protein
MRVDMFNVAKDGTAASQTLSRWDPRDTWSGSSDKDGKDASPGPESSEEPEPDPNSPWSESGSNSWSNFNSPLRPSSSASSIESPPWQLFGWTHASPSPSWGGEMAAEANPSSPDQSSSDQSSPHQTPTEAWSGSTSPGHAMPGWPSNSDDDPPPWSTSYETPKVPPPTPPDLSWTESNNLYPPPPTPEPPSDSYSHSTGPGPTGSDDSRSTGSGSTGSDDPRSTGSGTLHDSSSSNSWDRTPTDASVNSLSTGHTPPQSPAPSTGPQQSTDGLTPEPPSPAEPESETFLSKLLKGKIKRRTFGSRTVNAAQRELQDALDSRAYVPLSSLSCQPSYISSHKHSDFDLPVRRLGVLVNL